MGLYERLMGVDPNPRIPIHYFISGLAEFGRGRITAAQAEAIVTQATGVPLTAAEVTEAQTLLGTISGSAAAKLARAQEINDVLIIAEQQLAPYDTPAAVRARLGV